MFIYRSRYSLALAATILLALPQAHAQTQADITFSSQAQGGQLVTNSYLGSNSLINLGTNENPSLDLNHTGAASGDGSAGNAIIVTPISDPVIHFDVDLWNSGIAPLKEVVFHLPVSAAHPHQLGYLNPGYNTEGFGTGGFNAGKNFLFEFSNPVTPGGNSYDGDAAAFHGVPVYSTLRFFSNPTDPGQMDPGTNGHFHFYGAYPLNDRNAPLVYYADALSTDTNGHTTPTVFNTPCDPSGGIRPRSIPEPATLSLGALGIMGLLLRRRR